MKHALVPVRISTIPAGKFRRYHGESLLDKLKDVKTIGYNVRDLLFISGGFIKSVWMLITDRPDVVFAKGGYVCLPLGLAAALLRIPIVIHDSDARPGLTNKVLARFARKIGTGTPVENYDYDPQKTSYVGVPIQEVFRPFSDTEKVAARHEIGVIDTQAPLVVVTGGGLGSKSINDAMLRSGRMLIDAGVHVYHVAGKKHFEYVTSHAPDHPHYIVVPFVYKNMHTVLGAADIVVSRASATFIQELAGLAMPSIIIPAAQLGDQVKNADIYQQAKAALVLTDARIADDVTLGTAILSLIHSPEARAAMSRHLHAFAKPHAAQEMARMILSTNIKVSETHRGV
jgi:UDP-N-acetylglucosamine--N-acetylmuramyl-(pentapeptide) pyrophosphoryl-undecaprenol N-acetylglucosamine transferase